MDLVLNNLEWLICHQSKAKQSKPEPTVFIKTKDNIIVLSLYNIKRRQHSCIKYNLNLFFDHPK